MAHFVQLDDNNVVIDCLVVNDEYLKDENGNEVEALGCAHMEATHGGRWIQTSYNNRIRHRYAGFQYIYDEDRDVFLPPKPYDSWIVDETDYIWVSPVPKPTEEAPEGYYYDWNEDNLNWELKEIIIIPPPQ